MTGRDLRDAPGAGAAGGVGFGAVAVLGAELRAGADVVQELTGLEAALVGADLVVTGEGSLDAQTLHGKAPAGVAAAAGRAGVPVVAVAGRCVLDAATLRAAGFGAVHALTDLASYDGESFDAPGPLLERVGARIARHDMIGLMTPDLVLRARRAIVDGAETACSVVVSDGRIVAIEAYDAEVEAPDEIVLADDEVLLPGLVDTHVHVNEPGRTAWEGFASATRAAAAGGVTTIIDMPLNSVPPTTTLEALRTKQDVARDQIVVDVGFWGGAVPGNLADLAELHEAGVFGFKCFLIHSGVDEFAHLDSDGFAEAMDEVARLGALMLVHAEHADQVDDSRAAGPSYAGFLASRPPAAEQSAVAEVVAQAERTGARTHLLHLSSADAVPALRRARAGGADLTVETCPHYLVLEAGDVPDGATEFKCCPPIREAGNREQLWAALADGDIDLVVSDHSPSTAELKWAPGGPAHGDFGQAWGGIASLQVVPARRLDRRPRARSLARRRRPVDGAGPRRPGRPDAQGPPRRRGGRRPGRPRARRGVRRRRRPARAQEPGLRLRRSTPLRRRPWHLAAGHTRHRRSATRSVSGERTATIMSSYYAPEGGLPPRSRLTTDRAVFNEAYVVIPRGSMSDIVTSRLPFWDDTRLWVLARPLSGFAETFSQYLMEVGPSGGSNRPESNPDAEAVLFVLEGGLLLTVDGVEHLMEPGGYAYLPPGAAWTAHNPGQALAKFHWLRKAYERVEGLDVPEAFVVNERDVAPRPMPDTDGTWCTTRFVDPDDVRHDMHVNIVTFEPGGAITFPETHVMEHGIYVLEGKAVYLLNEDWVEVQAGDFLWLRAFCPQACYAGGPGQFRYLIYKDMHRQMRLGSPVA